MLVDACEKCAGTNNLFDSIFAMMTASLVTHCNSEVQGKSMHAHAFSR
jgi:hypothetical protein